MQVWSAIGKEFTLATNQVDFAIPKRFNLTFTDKKGIEQTPICIHRAPLSTHERFIGFLIEHYGGDFPLWLSPTQAIILPVSEKTLVYAKSLKKKFIAAGIRTKLDEKPEKIGAKIRQAEINKIPVMVIVGEKEADEKTVSVRRRFIGDQGSIKVEQLLKTLNNEHKQRSQPYRESQ